MIEDIRPVTGATINKQHTEIRKEVNAILERLQLRKWAVEQAVKSCDSACTNPEYIKEVTKFFYDFVTQIQDT